MLTATDISVFEGLVNFSDKSFSKANAKAVLRLKFSQKDHRKIALLSRKANEGTLKPKERELLESYVRVGDLLTILHARAEELLEGAGA